MSGLVGNHIVGFPTRRLKCCIINLSLTNGFAYHYHLGDCTASLRGSRSYSNFYLRIFDENPLSKQNSPRWDAAICGVTSGAMLFVYVPQKKDARLKRVKAKSLPS